MKKIVFLLFILGIHLTTQAQESVYQKGHGKISGAVVDAETNKPVEFANVALIDPKTKKPVDGAVADENGKFIISKVGIGTFSVAISFIGYETNTLENIIISDKKNEANLGTIKLGTSAKVLNEVVVEGQKQLIEERVDRTVYNAENDKTTAGGDATDVLKRVPMLSVDMDGNVSMRGNSNITVLINNKPSTITASSVADALKQIPADQIKSVEVITSPSAKYDAEGSAGIINIVTKKNNLQGATLGIDAGTGIRGSNLGLNGNLRTGKMGFSLSGFGRAGYNVLGSFENNQVITNLGADVEDPSDDTKTRTIQSADTRRNDMHGRYTLGWDYDINKNNFIAASVRFGLRNSTNYQDGLLKQSYDVETGSPIGLRDLRDVKITDNSNNIDVSLDYTHTYEKPQRELSFSSQFSRNNRDNNVLSTIYNTNDEIDFYSKNLNESYNQEITAQVDYQTPISTNQMLEVGGKNILRTVSSNFSSTNTVGSTNALNYDQNVTAGYISYTLTTKGAYSFKAGTRYENTIIDARYRDNTELPDPEIPSYDVLVPSVNVSKKLKNGNTVKLAYNRRIQRPSIQFLNPNVQSQNPLSESKGNPDLDPEFTNNYEISYSTFIKGTTLNFSAFVRNTTGAIQSIRNIVRDSVIQTTYDNIGQENAYGINVFANVNIGSKFSLNGGTDIYYADLDNNISDPLYAASNKGWVASGRLFGNYNLGKGWGFQFFGMLRGNRVNLQGSQGAFGFYNLGLRKEFNNKKGSIGFAAQNFLTSSMKLKNYTETPTIDQRSVNVMRNMNFQINFSYRIGKMSFENQRRKKSVNNDDLKDGGGDGMDINNNGGGGGQMQQQRGNGGRMPQMNTQPQVKAQPDTSKATIDATGVWEYTLETQMGSVAGKVTIKKVGEGYTGTVFSSRNNQEIALTSVTVSGNEITAIYTASMGGNEVAVTIKGPVKGDEWDATMSFGTFRTMPLKAKRTK